MRWWLALLLTMAACGHGEPSSPRAQPPIAITLLHTSDEHGWIQAGEQSRDLFSGGAAEMLGLWQFNEGAGRKEVVPTNARSHWAGEPDPQVCLG